MPAVTSALPGALEHPAEVFAYFRREGVPHVVCEEKHMGSRAVVVIACRDAMAARRRFGVLDEAAGIVYTRTGRRFFDDAALEAALVERVRQACEGAGLFDELSTDWVCLDRELLPWSAKAQGLLRSQYAAVGSAAQRAAGAAARALEGMDGPLAARARERLARVEAYVASYRQYCWPVASLVDLKLAPFHVLATEGRVHASQDHPWHMTMAGRLAAADPAVLRATAHLLVDVTDEASVAAGVAWWDDLTVRGGEGMVVKPRTFVARGARGLVQPAVKCRGRDYLRIIYGPEYDAPENLERLRGRRLSGKRSLALREFALGLESLERFVGREPLRRCRPFDERARAVYNTASQFHPASGEHAVDIRPLVGTTPLPQAPARGPVPARPREAALPGDVVSIRQPLAGPTPRTVPQPPPSPPPAAPRPRASGPDPRAPLFMEDPGEALPTEERPLMLSPIPTTAQLPTEPNHRTRVLLRSMVASAPSIAVREIVVKQLEAYGPQAVSLVHNHGTRIVVLPRNAKTKDAYAKYGLTEDSATDLKSDTGGMYDPLGNTLFLREDMLTDGTNAQLSASIARHEFAHALDDALGSALNVRGLYADARSGKGARTVTGYAQTNAAEYFAESTAAWLTPQDEFASRLNPMQRALFATHMAFSGFESPTREQLQQRDPAAHRMLDDLFANRLRSWETTLHRTRGDGYENWLWRAHQVDPQDSRIRLQLMDHALRQAPPGAPRERLERQIEAEYVHVENQLLGLRAAHPADRKLAFRMLNHYMERADRLEDGPRRTALENRSLRVLADLVRQDRQGLKKDDPHAANNLASDYGFLRAQFHDHRMRHAERIMRDVQDAMLRA